jgi:PPOX class probable F420-dependent enzyme
MAFEMTPEFEERIKQAHMIWLTTVRIDGMPQPTPVWFIWERDTFLIFSQPTAQKLRNIRQNPKVALNLDTEADGEAYLVIMGEAYIDADQVPSNRVAAYVEKYKLNAANIGYTPESLAATWSVAIRVKPVHIRGQ